MVYVHMREYDEPPDDGPCEVCGGLGDVIIDVRHLWTDDGEAWAPVYQPCPRCRGSDAVQTEESRP